MSFQKFKFKINIKIKTSKSIKWDITEVITEADIMAEVIMVDTAEDITDTVDTTAEDITEDIMWIMAIMVDMFNHKW